MTSSRPPLFSVDLNSNLDAEPLHGAHADRARATVAALGAATAAKLSRKLLGDRQIVMLAEPVEFRD